MASTRSVVDQDLFHLGGNVYTAAEGVRRMFPAPAAALQILPPILAVGETSAPVDLHRPYRQAFTGSFHQRAVWLNDALDNHASCSLSSLLAVAACAILRGEQRPWRSSEIRWPHITSCSNSSTHSAVNAAVLPHAARFRRGTTSRQPPLRQPRCHPPGAFASNTTMPSCTTPRKSRFLRVVGPVL